LRGGDGRQLTGDDGVTRISRIKPDALNIAIGQSGRKGFGEVNLRCCHNFNFGLCLLVVKFYSAVEANRSSSLAEMRIFRKFSNRLSLPCRINFRIETTLIDNARAAARMSKSSGFVSLLSADLGFSAAASDVIFASIICHKLIFHVAYFQFRV
jgi:hypothetical protein